VPLDDFRADEQSEPGARNRADAVGSIASFEHPAALAFGYSDTVIADRHPGLIVLNGQADLDVSPVGRILDRIADQILQNALDAALVVIHRNSIWWCRVPQRVTSNERLHLILRGLDSPAQISSVLIQRNATAVERMKV